jgi:hypothetical protein
MGVVVRHGRPEAVARSDDPEPHVRECRDGPGRTSYCHRRRPVQDHEGGGVTPDCFGAVSWEERQGGEVHGAADLGGAPQSHFRSVTTPYTVVTSEPF